MGWGVVGGGEVREGEGRGEGVTEWELLPIRSALCVWGKTWYRNIVRCITITLSSSSFFFFFRRAREG